MSRSMRSWPDANRNICLYCWLSAATGKEAISVSDNSFVDMMVINGSIRDEIGLNYWSRRDGAVCPRQHYHWKGLEPDCRSISEIAEKWARPTWALSEIP